MASWAVNFAKAAAATAWWLAAPCSLWTWTSILRTAVIFFYLSNEGVSLLENASHLGLPIPTKIKDVLKQLHDRAEEGDDVK